MTLDCRLTTSGLVGLGRNNPLVEKEAVNPQKENAEKSGEPAKDRYGKQMNDSHGKDKVNTGLKKSRELNWLKQCKEANTKRDTDVAIPDLRAVDDIGPFIKSVIKGGDGIWQYHQPAAQPANVLVTDEPDPGLCQPVNQPVHAVEHHRH